MHAPMTMTFYAFATYLEDTYGAQFDRDEGFVCCGECGEPLYSCDWSIEDYYREIDGEYHMICPVCETILDAE